MKKRLHDVYKNGGVSAVIRKSFEVSCRGLSNLMKTIYFKVSSPGVFEFNGNKLKYFRHNFNLAYQNERTIEVAIVSWFLDQQDEKAKILEVGHVLSNYGFNRKRDILDKYDSSPKVINQDVIDFAPDEKYDAIISISTLEHVGWDEPVRDAGKIPLAVKNLKENCLAPNGTMLVTLPVGYNAYFDEYIGKDGDAFTEKAFFKRVSADNKWRQVDYSEVAGSKFDEPYNNANAMFIGIVRA